MKLKILSFVRIIGTIFLVLYGAIVVPLVYGILRAGTALSGFKISILLPLFVVVAAVMLLAWYVRRQKAKQNVLPFYTTLGMPFCEVLKWLCVAIPVVLIPGLLLGLNFLINGSMEMVPTDEQQEKAQACRVSSYLLLERIGGYRPLVFS